MKTQILLLCCTFLMVAGCSPFNTRNPPPDLTPVQWSHPVGGFGHMSLAEDAVVGVVDGFQGRLATVSLPPEPKLRWKTSNNGWLGSAGQTVHSDYVYSIYYINKNLRPDAELDLGLYVFDLKTGQRVANLPFPTPIKNGAWIEKPPIVLGSKLYLANAGDILIYDISQPASPQLVRQFVAVGPGETTNIYTLNTFDVDSEGNVYTGANYARGENLFKYDSKGTLLWSAVTDYVDLNRPGDVAAQYSNVDAVKVHGNMVVVSNGQAISTFDKNTGKRIWVSKELQCDGGIATGMASRLTIDGGKVYLLRNSKSCIYAVDLSDGKIAWTVNAEDYDQAWGSFGAEVEPLYLNGIVYVTNSNLYAIEADSGKVLSISRNNDIDSAASNPIFYKGQILVWGEKLTAYKPVR